MKTTGGGNARLLLPIDEVPGRGCRNLLREPCCLVRCYREATAETGETFLLTRFVLGVNSVCAVVYKRSYRPVDRDVRSGMA